MRGVWVGEAVELGGRGGIARNVERSAHPYDGVDSGESGSIGAEGVGEVRYWGQLRLIGFSGCDGGAAPAGQESSRSLRTCDDEELV